MSDAHNARLLDRFRAYAAAFESAYETNDWSVLEPFFTDDATSELNGTRVTGRDAVIASFREAVTMFDRRFDSRCPRFVTGPAMVDGRVHVKTVSRYERTGLASLEVLGEEWFTFADDRIERHVDQVLNGTEVMGYLASHAEALRPLSPP